MSEHEYLSCVEALESGVCLNREQWRCLLLGRTEEHAEMLAHKAAALRDQIYGPRVFIRGLIEFTNVCRNDCYYCGIRKSNGNLERYRLTKEEILACCQAGHRLGFRTFVLQGGEDPWYTDEKIVDIVRTIRRDFPDCAITLSLGERERESFVKFKEAGDSSRSSEPAPGTRN